MRKILTIKAGESRILPKGAKIIKTATTGLTVTSTCPNIQEQLLNHEYYSCYSFSIGTAAGSGTGIGGSGNYMFGENMSFEGINVGGTLYRFSNPINFSGAHVGQSDALKRFGQFIEAIQLEILRINDLSGIFIDSCINVGTIENKNRGIVGFISFKSLPSLVEQSSTYLVGRYEGNEASFTPVAIPALPLDQFTGKLKPCPCKN